jgi:site-specific DNA recombinase
MQQSRRCAVYTRKSSEEGLDQAFNSLDAQREACEAYIKSQAHEGWKLVTGEYSDGGFSGGNMERPALKRLMADLRRGLIETIVVYKVDRLTRSLADFAKIVEVLDGIGASFVSITQQFNTTTSMGRLTLNVLLSFAQFEREVAGERIRDKILASKRKGMWMGGNVPLGYDVREKRLIPNQPEAETVCQIFREYLRLGRVADLQTELRRRQIVSKIWMSTKGNKRGGVTYSRGALYYLLRNPVYVGLILHKGERYLGQHLGIVPRELWDQVQARLDLNRSSGRRGRAKPRARLLAGILYDDRGNLMSPSFTKKKGGQRYPCYVSQALLQNRRDMAGTLPRVPAEAIERAAMVGAGLLAPQPIRQGALLRARHSDFREMVSRVILSRDRIEVHAAESSKKISMPGVMVWRDRALAFQEFGTKASWSRGKPSAALVKAICRASEWRERCERGEIKSYYQLARTERLAPSYVRANMQLAFVAPSLVESLLSNQDAFRGGVVALTSLRLPLSWHKQIEMLKAHSAGMAPSEGRPL